MYAEVAWVLVSLGTQAQLQVILDPDYLPDYLTVFYDYDGSSISLLSWSCLLILNISVNLASFAGNAEMTHLLVCNLKESYSSMLNNFWHVLQSIFNTFNNFS